MKSYWKKGVAVVLSASLVWTTGNYAQALPDPSAPLDLNPPSRLGYLSDSFNVHQVPQVILIQDLHANYGVQKNIAGILEFLSRRIRNTSDSQTFDSQTSGNPPPPNPPYPNPPPPNLPFPL